MEIDYEAVCGYERMTEYLSTIPERFPETEIGLIGMSILGRDIPYLRIGHGKSASLLVGAHHGMEHITSLFLIKFLEDSLSAERSGAKIAGGFDVRYIQIPALAISSTNIRDRVRLGKSVRYLTSESVMGYINKNRLYRM